MNVAFLRRLGHDLRGSLSNLRMALEACCQSPELLSQLGPALQLEVDRLDQRLQQSQWLARSYFPQKQPCTVPHLIQLWAEERGLQALCGPPFDAMVDPDLLRAAFHQLCDNAEQHGQGIGAIQVRADASHWELCLGDHGPGWPPGLASWLEEPQLWQGRLALGLPLVQKVLEAHQGTLLLERPPATWRLKL